MLWCHQSMLWPYAGKVPNPVCRQRRHTGFAWSLGGAIFAWSLSGTIFLHRRALQIQANGLGKLNYMGLFLHGCELVHEG